MHNRPNKEVMMKSAQSYLQSLADDSYKALMKYSKSCQIAVKDDLGLISNAEKNKLFGKWQESEEFFWKEYCRLTKELICDE